MIQRMRPHDRVPQDKPETWAARERAAREESFEELLDRTAAYEDMILDRATELIEEHFERVLEQLARWPALDDLDHEGWPYLTPVSKSGFLRHLFWANYEYAFDEQSSAFRKVVADQCRSTLRNRSWEHDLGFDFLMSACCIERGPATFDDLIEWAASRLQAFVWSELMSSDIDILQDLGIADPYA